MFVKGGGVSVRFVQENFCIVVAREQGFELRGDFRIIFRQRALRAFSKGKS
jgi:hypothetical protein